MIFNCILKNLVIILNLKIIVITKSVNRKNTKSLSPIIIIVECSSDNSKALLDINSR